MSPILLIPLFLTDALHLPSAAHSSDQAAIADAAAKQMQMLRSEVYRGAEADSSDRPAKYRQKPATIMNDY